MINDAEIIDAIGSGDNQKVFNELYKHVLPSIVKFIKSKRGNRQQAEDCFQDAVVALILTVKSGKYKAGYSVSNYLFGVARNRYYTLLRDDVAKETTLENETIVLIDENPLLETEKWNVIQEMLNKIGEQCKQLLSLHLFDRKKLSEIAKIMNFSSEGVVKTYNYRCKQKLKELIKEDEEILQVLKQ